MAKDTMTEDALSPRTAMVHTGTRRSQYGEMSEALYLTQGFAYPDAETAEARFQGLDGEDGFIYARYGNPTVAMFEDRIAALEGAEAAFATASGMAAVHGALFSILKAGDHLVASRALFGSCLYIVENLLPRFGVETTLVDGADLDAWRGAMRPETKAVFLETVSNPTLDVLDLKAIAEIAHQAGARVVVDNVFATPIYQRALTLGADVVIYSATKHIDGQGRCLGGVILGSHDFIRGEVEPFMKHTGGAMSPFNAWVMVKGMETLDIRVRAQAASASEIADAIASHANAGGVRYPGRADHPQADIIKAQLSGGGTVLAFEVAGGQAGAFRFMNALKIILISNNLGDTKTIATHPTTTTHQRLSEEQRATLGITPGLVRLSVGLEDPADLIRDITRALDAV